MQKLRFYLTHSFNDLRVNGQRTVFALLCIAAGVAAIVSLQTLGSMIESVLTTSLQESNKGDVSISAFLNEFELTEDQMAQAGEDGLVTVGGRFEGEDSFSENGIARVREWIDENYPGQIDMTYTLSIGFFTGASAPEKDTTVPFATANVVEAAVYPYYGGIESDDGVPLSDLLTNPTDIVLNDTLADKLEAGIGDTISINGATTDFTVTGIVSAVTGNFGDNIAGALFGAYYLDLSAAEFFPDAGFQATTLYWRLEDPTQATEITNALLRQYPYLETTTTDDLAEQNEQISDGVYQLVSVMGLLSMLLGGIGIVNTMQVIVRRRIVEVAVLKTIGLEANQVTALFLVEAALMGLIGSLLGVVLGWGVTLLLRGVAESFVAQSLPFRVAIGPVVNGLVIGVLVTTVFGFMPTLSAGQVRPGIVLRPADDIVPKAGRIRSLLALLLVVVVLTLIAATFIGTIASLVIPGAFVFMGLLYGLLSLLIWLMGRFFPSFGFVDLKVSLRAMLASRPRGASTLLALVVGVFTLSVITLLTGAVLKEFQDLLVDEIGGNAIVLAPATGDTLEQVEAVLQDAEGVNDYALVGTYSTSLIYVTDGVTGEITTYDEIKRRVDEAGLDMPFGGGEDAPQPSELLDFNFGSIDARQLNTNLPDLPFAAGRQLTTADEGEARIVISQTDFSAETGIEVGDLLTFSFEDSRLTLFGVGNAAAPRVTFEVVGIVDRAGFAGGFSAPNYASSEVFPETVSPTTVSGILDVDEAFIDPLRRELEQVPGVFVLKTREINDLINALVNQFTSLPILVAVLTLVVGGVVIANSVALSTLERRREIAVMKAVGLQRERVLGMLLLENGLMGLIGGFIGVGLSVVLLIILLTTIFPVFDPSSVPYPTALLLMLLCVAIAVGAAMITAWGASGEKPLNVLRYE